MHYINNTYFSLNFQSIKKKKVKMDGDDEGDNTVNQLILNVGDLLNQIQVFTGVPHEEPSINSFIENIDEIANLTNWSPETKCNVARLKMRKNAAQYKNAYSEVKNTTDWHRLCTLLKQQFKSHAPLLYHHQKFDNCKQLQSENVRQYASRLRSLAIKTINHVGTESEIALRYADLDDKMRDRFLVGLLPSIQRFTLSRAPQTFDSAIKTAESEEIIDLITKTKYVSMNAVTTEHDTTPDPPPNSP